MLLQRQKGHHRMRAQSYETRHPAFEHPCKTFPAPDALQKRPQPFFLLGAHKPRLEHIDRTAHRRGHESGRHARDKMRD